MDIVPSFQNEKNQNFVWTLKWSLYELKKSPTACFGKLSTTMVTLGYKQSNNNHTLSSKYSKKRIYIFLVYVDDIIFLGDDLEQMYHLNGNLLVYFKIN